MLPNTEITSELPGFLRRALKDIEDLTWAEREILGETPKMYANWEGQAAWMREMYSSVLAQLKGRDWVESWARAEALKRAHAAGEEAASLAVVEYAKRFGPGGISSSFGEPPLYYEGKIKRMWEAYRETYDETYANVFAETKKRIEEEI